MAERPPSGMRPARRGDKAVRAQSVRGRMALEGLYIPAGSLWLADFRGRVAELPQRPPRRPGGRDRPYRTTARHHGEAGTAETAEAAATDGLVGSEGAG
jgi:hypothetical protein